MLKTHEKSRIRPVRGTKTVSDIKEIIIQLEATGIISDGNMIYLVETVEPKDYNRTTAEGRAAEAEKSLQEETEAHKIEMEEAEAKIEALEELLAEAKDAREGMRKGAAEVQKENGALYEALVECRRIFGELPKEIEDLIAKGEDGKCIL